RPACTPGTRVEILEKIMKWANTASEDQVYWIGGMAGTGKSTIAKSLCDEFEKESLAGAFFCSRQLDACRDYTRIIPTIAYQLARYSHTFAEALARELENDRDLADKDIDKQIAWLLMKPWEDTAHKMTAVTAVIIIDALDECTDIKLFLEPLLNAIQSDGLLGLKFIFTSRPDQPVYKHLMKAPYNSKVFLHEVEKDSVERDIAKFLSEELENHGFVTPEHISQLTELSGKLFIFAATTVKWITERDGFEKGRLNEVLKLQHGADESETKELDDLYNVIVTKAMGKATNEERKWNVKVLHSIITVRDPVPSEVIAQLVKVEPEQVEVLIAALQSVLYVGKMDKAIYVFHASFSDFLLGKERAKDLQCNSVYQHKFLGQACFNIMNTELKFNMLNLPSSFLKDKEVENIVLNVNNQIKQSLVYACKNWEYHLKRSPKDAEVTRALKEFSNKKILYWVEAMSLLRLSNYKENSSEDTLVQCGDILESVRQDFQISDLSEELRDSINNVKIAVETFLLSPVNAMTPHWYLSILPFWRTGLAGAQQGMEMGITVKSKMEKPNLAGWNTGSEVLSIDISKDGTRIVSGSVNMTARIWNIKNGSPIGEPLQGHTNGVGSVAFSPDGKRIVSGSADKTIRIWNAETGSPIGEHLQGHTDWPLQGHTDWVWSVACSPDGKRILSGSADKTIQIWNAETGTPIGEPLQGHTDWVGSVVFSPDGKRIVSGSGDKTIRIWNAETGSPIGEPLQGHTDGVSSVAFSPDGRRIVSGSVDKTVRIWNAETGTPIGEPLQGHTNGVQSVAFSPNGQRIVSGYDDKTVRIWTAETGTPIGEPLQGLTGSPLQGHTDGVWSVAFALDGKRIVSGSGDKTVRIWNAGSGTPIGEPLQGHTHWVGSVAFSPDGKRIVSGSGDKTVRIWSTETGTAIGEPLQGHTHWVESVAFSPDSKRIVSGSNDKTVRIWNAETGTPIGEPLQGHTNWVQSVACSPDGKRIVSGSRDKTVRIWNAETGTPIGEPLQGHSNWTVRIWNAETGTPIGEPLQGHTHWVWSVAFSPDGKRIVSGSRDKTVRIWNAETGAPIGEPLQGLTGSVESTDFFPDEMPILSNHYTSRAFKSQTNFSEVRPSFCPFL
ncbi:hypothetical protein GYMLUDRAFT_156943, partial [Collybiopsis luxurians FD-317 M1]